MFKFAAMVYQYLKSKNVDMPYFRAIMILVFLFFMHLVQIGLIFKIPSDWLLPWSSGERKVSQWLKASLFFGVIITLFFLLFKKARLEKEEISEALIKRSKFIIPLYFVISAIILFGLLLKSGIERGIIK